jgi:uridine kinase
VLTADGIFAFRPENNRYCDFRIWLDVNPETRYRRLHNRTWKGA